MYVTTENEDFDEVDYVMLDNPRDLIMQERDELVFAVLEHLGLKVYRAKFDPTFLVLHKP